jgi:hypothetical protein
LGNLTNLRARTANLNSPNVATGRVVFAMHTWLRGGEHMPAGTPIQVRLQGEELAALDRRRREQPNPPSRGSELRKLIRAVLLDSHNEGRSQNRKSSLTKA